ncbi:MAG: hypothetical protein ABI317_01245, partial [Gaiellales bacterium]
VYVAPSTGSAPKAACEILWIGRTSALTAFSRLSPNARQSIRFDGIFPTILRNHPPTNAWVSRAGFLRLG